MSRPRPPDPPEVRARPARGRVLVIAPHPDDETMGLGGTLAMHAAQGDPVTALFVCSGIQGDPRAYFDRTTLEERRRAEAQAAAKVLGIGDLRFLGYPDNLSEADFDVFEGLPDDPNEQRWKLIEGFANDLATLIRGERFTIVYHPWSGELNADHWALGQAVDQLRERQPDLEQRAAFLGYDVWTPLAADTVVDVSDVEERKIEALHCYRTQEAYLDYERFVRGLDAYRAIFLEAGATYGEAFAGRYHPEEEA